MAKRKPENERLEIHCRYFKWRLSRRKGVWQADGRSNSVNAGRHSLGTKNRDEAMQLVHDLDLKIAVDFGMADRRQLQNVGKTTLEISVGISLFEQHTDRPVVAGGPKPSTRKRYRRISRAFRRFADLKRIKFWERVDATVLNDFATSRAEICTHATIVTEVSLIKSMHAYLIEERHLDADYAFKYQVRRPKQSTKYCPTAEELKAILAVLDRKPSLRWIRDIVLILSNTGLRFGELAQLTSEDVEHVESKVEFLLVRDESSGTGTKSTKTGYDRKVPLQKVVKPLLKRKVAQFREGPLFRGPRGGKLRNDTFGDNLRQHALKPLRSEYSHSRFQKITAHSFRHFFASYCAGMGVSQQTLMDWMGHRTDSMAKRYFHSNDEASLRNIQKLEPLIPEEDDRPGDTDDCAENR